jgi:hypothetical protein
MNIKEFAKMLNGRQYGSEITKEEEVLAKELGFVVVFGSSDDNMEFRGVIDDEVECYDGGTAYVNEIGLVAECECDCMYYQIERDKASKIKAIWHDHGVNWTYETDISHEKFEIFEDEELYCVGILFDINDLAGV